ncbi:AAA family ATPase [Saccharopolyspora sp. NPDC002376]
MASEDQQGLQHGTSVLVIARNIRNKIEAGELVHEQQLPSTRELAKEWGTSVATINRAMGVLADEGLVLNRARSSRIVNYPSSAGRPAEQSVSPHVIMVGGYAGSGKTELGRVLARRAGWPMLDKDTTTRAVVEAALEMLGKSPHDRESDVYLNTIRPAEYEALAAAMTENLMCGNSAIVTAPFIRELSDRAWCERTSATVESMGAQLHVVWVRCDADSMRAYLKQRGAARDATKLANWTSYLDAIDLDFTPAIEHGVIENSVGSRPLQQQAAELLQRIES